MNDHHPMLTARSELSAPLADDRRARLQRWILTEGVGYAENTCKALISDWRHFADWCAGRRLGPGEVSEYRIVEYLMDHRTLAIATQRRRINSLAVFFRAIGRGEPDNPAKAGMVAAALRKQARQHSAHPSARQQRPITWQMIQRGRERIDPEDLMQLRALVMVQLAYDGLLRRSELCGARVWHLEPRDGAPLGQSDAQLLIPHSKTDQDGNGAYVFCVRDTAALVAKWIDRLSLEPEHFLFPVQRGLTLVPSTEQPMSPVSVARIFRKFAQLAGDSGHKISGHSCRIGAAQDMVAGGIRTDSVAISGRWKSHEMVIRYGSGLDLQRSGIAQLARAQGRIE